MNIKKFIQNSELNKLETRMLLKFVLQCDDMRLIAHDEDIIAPHLLQQLNALVQRRVQGEPMAYLLGQREFYSRMFQVSSAVLIPRPETEHLVEAVLAKLPHQGRLWDLGTGSGIIGITCQLERPDVVVWASDISQPALVVAQNNAQRLGANINWACGSWFAVSPQPNQPFDVLVANPPYIAQNDPHLQQGDLRFEPPHALSDGADGLQHIHHLAQHAHRFLKPDGLLMLEHGCDQAPAVQHILRQQGFDDIHTQTDLAGLARLTHGRLCVHHLPSRLHRTQ